MQKLRPSPSILTETSHGDIPELDFQLQWVQTRTQLEPFLPGWKRLLETAIEPNVFFEPEVLLPALEGLAEGAVTIGLVHARSRRNPDGPLVLAGLIPIVRRRGRAETWLHRYAFQGTPLVRADVAQEVWTFLLRGGLEEPSPLGSLWRLRTLNADGPCLRALLAVATQGGYGLWTQSPHLRAEFVPAESDESYRQQNQRRKVRRNLKRQMRLLAERGKVDCEVEFLPADRSTAWADRFLALEASGWKGRAGTALQAQPKDAEWFRQVLRGLAPKGRLLAGTLTLDGAPIAMGVLFCADPDGAHGAFFKIAFDERHADVSAGALLQQEWIRFLHAEQLPGVPQIVDSCANPGHPMIERLWGGRRMVQHLWIARPGLLGRLRLLLFQALYALKPDRSSGATGASKTPSSSEASDG